MEENKIAKPDVPRPPSFIKRYRVFFFGLGGMLALHVGWWAIVESYVPPEQRAPYFQWLAKLEPLKKSENEKK